MKKEASIGRIVIPVLLAYISGFVDALSFVALFGMFAAHVTGNFVLIATSLAEYRHGLWMKLLAVPIFIVAAICTRFYIIRRERNRLDAAAHVLIGQAVLLTAFMVVATENAPFAHHESLAAIVTGLLASAAMAIQNTAARTFLSDLPPTTVMTGNLIQVIVDFVDLTHGREPNAKRARLAKLVPMLVAFLLGTLSGAVGYVIAGFLCLVVPIVVISLVSALVRHRDPVLA